MTRTLPQPWPGTGRPGSSVRSLARTFACVVTVLLTTSLVFLALSAPAHAQQPAPANPGADKELPARGQPPASARAGANADAAEPEPRNSTGFALLFWLFALMAVGGSVFVITRSNLISAVMGMVGTFFAIAVIYAMLYAHFLAAIQVLVYAGAIMVLFVFVIMILNKPETTPWSEGATGLAGTIVVAGVLLFLLVRLIAVLWNIDPTPDSLAAPGAVVDSTDWGSTKAVGAVLFRDYLFPFEAVSIVLLIAVVGAVAVARPHERPPASIPDGVPGGARPDGSSSTGKARS